MNGLSKARECGQILESLPMALHALPLHLRPQTDSSGVPLRKKTACVHDSRLPFHVQGLPHLHGRRQYSKQRQSLSPNNSLQNPSKWSQTRSHNACASYKQSFSPSASARAHSSCPKTSRRSICASHQRSMAATWDQGMPCCKTVLQAPRNSNFFSECSGATSSSASSTTTQQSP